MIKGAKTQSDTNLHRDKTCLWRAADICLKSYFFEDLCRDLEDYKSTKCILSVQSVLGHGGAGGSQLSRGAGSVHTVLLRVRCLLCFW